MNKQVSDHDYFYFSSSLQFLFNIAIRILSPVIPVPVFFSIALSAARSKGGKNRKSVIKEK